MIQTPQVALGEGKQNYLLVSIYIHGETLFARTLVRAHKDSHSKSTLFIVKLVLHNPIYLPAASLFENLKNDMAAVGLCTKPLGGGKMNVNEKARSITIGGACGTFGQADHQRAKEILKSFEKYSNYKISVRG
ncbi:hypothetical protein KR044_007234 [Drosophila immigrans]|nr:hypothetical protein KR044_007234 [Drosophila immigrans]